MDHGVHPAGLAGTSCSYWWSNSQVPVVPLTHAAPGDGHSLSTRPDLTVRTIGKPGERMRKPPEDHLPGLFYCADQNEKRRSKASLFWNLVPSISLPAFQSGNLSCQLH